MRTIRISLVSIVLAIPALGAQASVRVAPDHRPEHTLIVAGAVERFESVVESHADCVGGYTIEFADLPGRGGEYRSASASVVIDDGVPLSMVPLVVTHELAHHAMISCELHNDPVFKSRFFAAGDIDQTRSWFDYSRGWADTPAELFAEALTVLVAGRSAHGEAVPPEVVDVVEAWLSGPAEPGSTPAALEPLPEEQEVGRRAAGMQPLLGARRAGSQRPSRFGS